MRQVDATSSREQTLLFKLQQQVNAQAKRLTALEERLEALEKRGNTN